MAPEYLKGKLASPASDVFSMAVVAWEGLTCKRLFRTDDEVETMQRILDDTPAPLVSDVMFVDPSIDAIIARALEKDPARRFPSAAAFADDVRRYLSNQPILARPATLSYQLSKFAKRHRSLVAGVLIALLAGLALVTLVLKYAVEQRVKRVKAAASGEHE